MSARRLIFVNRVYWPNEAATAQLLTDLAEGLAAPGADEVHVITGGSGPSERHGVTIHRTGGEERHRDLLAQLRNYVRFLACARAELARLCRAGDVVILKTDPPLLSSVLTAPARRRGATVVQWLQDIYPEIIPAHFGAWAKPLVWPLRAWRDAAWHRSHACVVVGDDMAPTVTAAGLAAARVPIHQNWAPRELAQAPAAAAVAEQRRAWGLADRFIVAYSGNLGRVHEFATLLDTAAQLAAEPRVAFAFIGGGPRMAEVQQAVAARGLHNVHFFPAVPRAQLAVGLASADCHVVTLRPGFERFVNPSKLAGIMAAARPALFIGAPTSVLAARLRTSGAGAVVANGDAAAAAAVLRHWIQSPEQRAAAGVAARAIFEAQFRFERSVTQWTGLIRNLNDR